MSSYKYLLLLVFVMIYSSLHSQIMLQGYQKGNINPELYKGQWSAHWIAVPNEPANVYGVYHFRRSFNLDADADKFIIHVSADNRYKLFINEKLVSLGPARGDLYNWNFETVDLAPYLHKGKNVLAAVVWNYAEKRPLAQISYNQTGFIVQGNTKMEEIVNTNNSWVCLKNSSYYPWEQPVYGYYVAGPGELLNAAAYPWGWEQSDYDDSNWLPAKVGMAGAMKGGMDYPGRLLTPSSIPQMERKVERLVSVKEGEGIEYPKNFPLEKKEIIIPANTKVHLILDQSYLITGYLSLLFSKGKNAEIRIGYTEAFYNDIKTGAKGNRNEVHGKAFIGYEDKVISDGGNNRLYTSLWWRTWRYINLQVITKDEPLLLEDIYGVYAAYPFKNETTFSAPGHPDLNKMLEIGWRTARLCANETYMDCPYYEQLQYFGDTRIQAMISLFNTHDPYMVKHAIEQGRQSIVAAGITMSRYPTYTHQFISSFSLLWILTGYDYWMYRGDEGYMKSLLPAYRDVLSWYEQWLKPDHSLGYVPYWFFADWAEGFPNGEALREKNGDSAFQDLMYLLTLDATAKMEQDFGIPGMSVHYKNIANALRKNILAKYWDKSHHLFADTKAHLSFSQHVNSLAVLAGIVKGDTAKSVMTHVLKDKNLIQATIYFRYYVHQALNKAGLGDQLLGNLQVWRDQMLLGVTTWAERPEPSRSDCHAWGASLNIEFYRMLLGIDTDAPGFKKVKIAPSLGTLKEVSGSMPHPQGTISADYKIDKKGILTARITLPVSLKGTFIWKGKQYRLEGGEQVLKLNTIP